MKFSERHLTFLSFVFLIYKDKIGLLTQCVYGMRIQGKLLYK